MDDPESKLPARDEKGRLLPGNTGNAGGRPRTAKMFREWLDAIDPTKDLDRRRAVWKRTYEIAMNGKDSDANTAIRLICEYDMGRPAQIVTDEDGKSLSLGIVVLPEHKLDA